MGQTRIISIPAATNGAAGLHVETLSQASVFQCIAADAGFRVQPDTGDTLSMNAGRGFTLPFHRLTFLNDLSQALNVEYYTGDTSYSAPSTTAQGQKPNTFIYLGLNPVYAGTDSSSYNEVTSGSSFDIASSFNIGGLVFKRYSVTIFQVGSGYGTIVDRTGGADGNVICTLSNYTGPVYLGPDYIMPMRIYNKSGSPFHFTTRLELLAVPTV